MKKLVDDLNRLFGRRVRIGPAATNTLQKALWNGDEQVNPLAVVPCSDTHDVQQVVRLAAENRLPIGVFGGGHDWAARSAASGAVVIDLRSMVDASFDAGRRSVRVSGGCLTSHVLQALPSDYVPVTGTVATVGVAGLTLGGGYGRLTNSFGLASDNLLSAEVVLADGSLVLVNEHENADIFWALRGGGGNFGVVTSMELLAHPVTKVSLGMITVPLNRSLIALLRVQEMLDGAPDEFSILSGFASLSPGEAVLFLQPCCVGESESGRKILDELCKLDGATILANRESFFRETFNPDDEKMFPHGAGYKLSARNIRRLTPETVEPLVAAAAQMFASPGCAIVIHDFRGFATRIPVTSTAFPLRKEHFNIELIARWGIGLDIEKQQAKGWLNDLVNSLEALVFQGGYANLLGPDEAFMMKKFYEPSLERLSSIKRARDPFDLFRFNIGHVTG